MLIMVPSCRGWLDTGTAVSFFTSVFHNNENNWILDLRSALMLSNIVQTGSGVHPTSYPMSTGGSDIHALSGIRTHDPNVRASEDSSCLRPRGRCDRQWHCYRCSKYWEIICGQRRSASLPLCGSLHRFSPPLMSHQLRSEGRNACLRYGRVTQSFATCPLCSG
jgi:hypothetical protein